MHGTYRNQHAHTTDMPRVKFRARHTHCNARHAVHVYCVNAILYITVHVLSERNSVQVLRERNAAVHVLR
jgi:hypothetical protein